MIERFACTDKSISLSLSLSPHSNSPAFGIKSKEPQLTSVHTNPTLMELLKNPKLEPQEDDDEESLSLIDLPLNLSQNQPTVERSEPIGDDFNFDFNLYNCSVFSSEMCAADDVFFKGQMLPYRHSISSDTGVSLHPARYVSRSESMDHCSTRGAISSRSSSLNSQDSSSSGSVTGAINPKHRTRNYFHSHPSPSPRIQNSHTRYGNAGSLSRKSNLWDFFRVGLVKTPEIELRDIKNRSINGNSRYNFGSRNSTGSNCSSQNRGNKIGDERIVEKKKKFYDFSGCKCSVNVINPVNCEEREKGMKTEERQNKTASSRYRTFEWLKELSVECAPDEA